MGSFNYLVARAQCPSCGYVDPSATMQVEIDRHTLDTYRAGERTDWFGCRPRGGSRAFDAWGCCDRCGLDYFVFVVVRRDVILEPVAHPLLAGYSSDRGPGPGEHIWQIDELRLNSGLKRLVEALDGALSGVMLWRDGARLVMMFSRVIGFQGISLCSAGIGDPDGLLKKLKHVFSVLSGDDWAAEMGGGFRFLAPEVFDEAFIPGGETDWVRDRRHIGLWFDRGNDRFSFCLHEAAPRCYEGPHSRNEVQTCAELEDLLALLMDFLGPEHARDRVPRMDIFTSEITLELLRRLRARAVESMNLVLPGDILVCDVWKIPEDCRACGPREAILRSLRVFEFREFFADELQEIPRRRVREYDFPFLRGWEASAKPAPDGRMFREFLALFEPPYRCFTTVSDEDNFDRHAHGLIRDDISLGRCGDTDVMEGGFFVVDAASVDCFWFATSKGRGGRSLGL